jgi:hypothetical protein
MRFLRRRPSTGTLFEHPLSPAPKTTVLARGFQSTRNIRVFADGWSEAAARLGPCALAASLEELRRLAALGIQVQHAVIVLTSGALSSLTEEDRDLLWRAFGVPVFEQCLGPDNQLLAAECEAHDGLHVVGGVHNAGLQTDVCGCGSSVPRMMPVRELIAPALMYA